MLSVLAVSAVEVELVVFLEPLPRSVLDTSLLFITSSPIRQRSGSCQQNCLRSSQFLHLNSRISSCSSCIDLNVFTCTRDYSAGSCYQDRLQHGCCSRAYRDVLTACLDNSFQIYISEVIEKIYTLIKNRAFVQVMHSALEVVIKTGCGTDAAVKLTRMYHRMS